jgi:hypothetical protein
MSSFFLKTLGRLLAGSIWKGRGYKQVGFIKTQHLLRAPFVDLSKWMLSLVSTPPRQIDHNIIVVPLASIDARNVLFPAPSRWLPLSLRRAEWRRPVFWVAVFLASLCAVRCFGSRAGSTTLLAFLCGFLLLLPCCKNRLFATNLYEVFV